VRRRDVAQQLALRLATLRQALFDLSADHILEPTPSNQQGQELHEKSIRAPEGFLRFKQERSLPLVELRYDLFGKKGIQTGSDDASLSAQQ
jgi:hypothetical protein